MFIALPMQEIRVSSLDKTVSNIYANIRWNILPYFLAKDHKQEVAVADS